MASQNDTMLVRCCNVIALDGSIVQVVIREDGRVATRSRGLVVWDNLATIDDVRTRHHGVNCSSDTLPDSLTPQPTPLFERCCRGWIGHALGRCSCV